MILLNELYKIENKGENSGYEIRMIPDSLIYRAHFPDEPITPGVCIIQIVTEMLEKLLNNSLELCEVTNAKFLAVIDPRIAGLIRVNFTKIIESETGIKINALVADSETIYTKLSLAYIKI